MRKRHWLAASVVVAMLAVWLGGFGAPRVAEAGDLPPARPGLALAAPGLAAPGLAAIQPRVAPAAPVPDVAPLAALSVPFLSVTAGQSFAVDVSITTTTYTRAAQIGLLFNPAVLACQSVTEGTFYKSWTQANGGNTIIFPAATCDNVNGVVTDFGVTILGGPAGQGPSGSGLLATLHFTALANGVSPLTLQDVIISDADVNRVGSLTTVLTNGQVAVGATPIPSPSATPTPSATASRTASPTQPTVTATPTATALPTSTSTPPPSATATRTATATPSPTRAASTTATTIATATTTAPQPTGSSTVTATRTATASGSPSQTTPTPSPTRTQTTTATATLTPSPTQATPTPSSTSDILADCLAADVNHDGAVNVADLAQVGLYFGQTGAPGWISSDAIVDGVINVLDEAFVGGCMTSLVPNDTPTPSATPSATTVDQPSATATATPGPLPTTTPTLTATLIAATASPSATTAGQPTLTATSTVVATPLPSATNAVPATSTATTNAPAAVISLNPSSQTVAAQQTFTVSVMLTTSQASRAAQFGIVFDPAVLACQSVDAGSFFQSWAASHGASTITFPTATCDNANGFITDLGITILGAAGAGPSGSGVLATLHFKAIADGFSSLAPVDVLLSDADPNQSHPLLTTVTNGQVLVGSGQVPSATATPTASRTPTASATATATPTGATLTPTQTPSATVAPSLTASRTSTASLTPSVTAAGPTKTATPSPTGPTATLTLIPSSTPRPSETLRPTQASNWSMSMSPSVKTVAHGASFTVDIALTGDPDHPSTGAQAALQFNPALLRCDGIDEGAYFSTWAQGHGGSTLQFPAGACDNTNGLVTDTGITILGGSAGGPTGNGTFLTLHFTALASGVSSLGLTHVILADDSVNRNALGLTLHNGQVFVDVLPSPTSTSNGTPSSTPSRTPTRTGTPPTATPTRTKSPTPTKSATPTRTATSNGNSPTPTWTPTQTATPAGSLSLSAPSQAVAAGQTFTVSLQVNLNVQSRAAQFGLKFNPAVVTCQAATEGAYYKTWAAGHGSSTLVFPHPVCNNTTGTLSDMGIAIVGGTSGDGPTGSGLIASIRFQALAAGTTPITLTDVLVGDDSDSALPLPVTVSNAQVSVSGGSVASPTPTPTRTATASPTLSPTPSPTPSATNTHATSTHTPTPTTGGGGAGTALHTETPKPVFTAVPTVASSAELDTDPNPKVVAVGEQFTLEVVFKNVDQASTGAQADIAFDPAVLQCDSIDEGTFYSTYADAHNGGTLLFPPGECDNTAGSTGSIGISLQIVQTEPQAHLGGATGGGTFVTIHFTAKANGISPITISHAVVSDDSSFRKYLQVTAHNGQVFVGVTPTASPTGGTAAATSSVSQTPDPNSTQGTPTATTSGGQGGGGGGGGTNTGGGSGGTGAQGTPSGSTTPGSNDNGSGTPEDNGGGNSGGDVGTAPPPAGTIVPTAAGVDLGEHGGGGSVGAGFDISHQIKASGILSGDVALVSPDSMCASSLARDTQALTAGNLPLQVVTINHLGQPLSLTAQLLAGTQCEFGPAGAKFDPPITITLAYDPGRLPKGVDPKTLVISYYDETAAKWVVLPSRVNTAAHSVTARVAHFSLYALQPGASAPNWLPWLAGSVVVEVIVSVLIVVYVRRRRRPGPTFGPPWGDIQLLPAPAPAPESEPAMASQTAGD